ncbi:MAG TPA: thiamine phosphate synthase [Actinomycetota bacterium]|nr:thiamine phosphate synthase [Actinomycetota bacterium]
MLTSAGLVPGRGHLDVARAAVAGGATAVQLRAKELGPGELLPMAGGLRELCRPRGVLAVVNDEVEVAVESGVDGVHVGRDRDLRAVRRLLGRGLVLGASVGSPEEVRAAEEAGADYLGVTVWATATKPEAEPVGLEGLRAVARATRLPVVGIGGVTAANAHLVLAAGAAGVAVVSAVGAAPDPVAATRELAAAVEQALGEGGGGVGMRAERPDPRESR